MTKIKKDSVCSPNVLSQMTIEIKKLVRLEETEILLARLLWHMLSVLHPCSLWFLCRLHAHRLLVGFHYWQMATDALRLPESLCGTLSVHLSGNPEPTTYRHRSEFLNPSMIDACSQIFIYGGVGGIYPMYCRMLSILDFYPLGTSTTWEHSLGRLVRSPWARSWSHPCPGNLWPSWIYGCLEFRTVLPTTEARAKKLVNW